VARGTVEREMAERETEDRETEAGEKVGTAMEGREKVEWEREGREREGREKAGVETAARGGLPRFVTWSSNQGSNRTWLLCTNRGPCQLAAHTFAPKWCILGPCYWAGG
jgi:hypothetical protein